jgi:hypothetical protein
MNNYKKFDTIVMLKTMFSSHKLEIRKAWLAAADRREEEKKEVGGWRTEKSPESDT